MTLIRVVGFSLLLCLFFLGVTWLLPQVEGEAPAGPAPPAQGRDALVVLGERIFNGRGNCSLCHRPPPLGRAPDIKNSDMVAVAAQRLRDARYQGQATDAEGYLRESMKAPDRYVVAGWGQKGSGDTKSPMPAVQRPPIGLSEQEIDAVIAYLQAKDGHPVTVAPAVVATPVSAPAVTAEEAIRKHGCRSCHRIGGAGGVIGPDLSGVANRLAPERIRESIIDPDAVIAGGFPPGVMPGDFAQRMTVRELELIVTRLLEER